MTPRSDLSKNSSVRLMTSDFEGQEVEYFKKCPKCGRYMVSEIISTGHIKWMCVCGNVVHTGFIDVSYDNKITYTGGVASDRTVN